MIIYDISKDAITTPVYEGDPETKVIKHMSLEAGDSCNLSEVSMCVHSGTHIDAPLHFVEDGNSIDNIRLSTFYGKATVVTVDGILTGADMDRILPNCKRRVIFKGNGKAFLSHSAALVLAESNVVLVGTDACSIAADYDEIRPHAELARAGILVLENLNLSEISDGEYELCAFPIKLCGLEAAPCRAILFEQEKGLN